jgi:hypothetical protein
MMKTNKLFLPFTAILLLAGCKSTTMKSKDGATFSRQVWFLTDQTSWEVSHDTNGVFKLRITSASDANSALGVVAQALTKVPAAVP